MDFESIDEMREYFSHDEMAAKCLGATLDDFDCETGEATVSMTIDDRHHNAQGFVMGGVPFALADFALAVASNVGQPPTSSVSHSIQLMRRVKGERLIARARPDKLGRTMAYFTVDVTDGEGRHVARMTATCARTDH